MASERLTDKEFDLACMAPDDDSDPYPASWVRKLAHEVRAHRALLTPEDVEALRWLRRYVEGRAPVFLPDDWHRTSLAVLDKLLAERKGEG